VALILCASVPDETIGESHPQAQALQGSPVPVFRR